MAALESGAPYQGAVDRDHVPGGTTVLEPAKRPTREEAMEAVRTLIAWAGDDPRREGVIDTPKRVVDAYAEWFEGYEADPAKELSRTFEDVQGYDDIVMLRDIEVESHCEHHARLAHRGLARKMAVPAKSKGCLRPPPGVRRE